jgi:hypothetical protein
MHLKPGPSHIGPYWRLELTPYWPKYGRIRLIPYLARPDDDAVMRIIKKALNKSGNTVYQLPEQATIEALIDELNSGSLERHSTTMGM